MWNWRDHSSVKYSKSLFFIQRTKTTIQRLNEISRIKAEASQGRHAFLILHSPKSKSNTGLSAAFAVYPQHKQHRPGQLYFLHYTPCTFHQHSLTFKRLGILNPGIKARHHEFHIPAEALLRISGQGHVQLEALSSFITGLGDYISPSAHFGFNFHGLGWAERPICQQHTIACILIDWQMREEFCIYYNEVHSTSNIGSSFFPMVFLLKEMCWHPSALLHTKASRNKIKHNRKSKHLQVFPSTH